MIDILFTSFKKPFEPGLYSEYLSLLPVELRERNERFIRWRDRHSHLIGKLLLIEAFKLHGIEKDIWQKIEYNTYKRPCLTIDNFDFNISHSGDYVVCAIGENTRLGIDIEQHKKTDIHNFRKVMTLEQWEVINNAEYPIEEFYRFWTIKESVIKADGRGFVIPLDKLEVFNNTVFYEDKTWFIKELKIDNDCSASLAMSKLKHFEFHEINFCNKIDYLIS